MKHIIIIIINTIFRFIIIHIYLSLLKTRNRRYVKIILHLYLWFL